MSSEVEEDWATRWATGVDLVKEEGVKAVKPVVRFLPVMVNGLIL
jgi:hypothetical protein